MFEVFFQFHSSALMLFAAPSAWMARFQRSALAGQQKLCFASCVTNSADLSATARTPGESAKTPERIKGKTSRLHFESWWSLQKWNPSSPGTTSCPRHAPESACNALPSATVWPLLPYTCKAALCYSSCRDFVHRKGLDRRNIGMAQICAVMDTPTVSLPLAAS